jgi:hypothetical protein
MTKPTSFPTVSDETDEIVDQEGAPLDPAVAGSFKLLVAGVDSNMNLVTIDQTEPNGPFATNWTPIGSGTYAPIMATGTTLDGRIAIIAPDFTSHHIMYIAEALDASQGRWAAPEDLGLPPGVSNLGTLALVRGVNGLDNIFGATNEDGNKSIWWKYRNPPKIVTKEIEVTPPGSQTPIKVTVQETEPPDQPWSDWININGALEGTLRGLKACNNADGRIVLTGIYTNAIPWVRQQKAADPFNPEDWGDWQVPGAPVTESSGALQPALDMDGRVSVFASTNNGLLRSRQTAPGADSWTAWSAPGLINDNIQKHAVSIDGDGGLTVAALNYPPKGESAFIYATQQVDNAAFAQWTGWQWIAMISNANEIALNFGADGRLFLFAYDYNAAKLSVIEQVALNATEWTVFWTELSSHLRCFGVAQDLTP